MKILYYSTGLITLFFLSCNAPAASTPESTAGPEVAATNETHHKALDGQFCFHKEENKDVTDISLNISGNVVGGTMDWLPFEKDGASGTLSGWLHDNGEMELVYDYTIEGSKQNETKVMKIDGNKLWIKVGELVDPKNNGHLRYKDVATAQYTEALDKIDCL